MTDAAQSTVLVKSTQILNAVSDASKALRFKDIQRATGLSNSTLNRLLGDLLSLGLLHHDPEGASYSIGPRLIGWAHRAWQDLPIRQAAGPSLTALRDHSGETVHLAVLDGHHITYVDKQESLKSIRMYSAIGRRGPLHCTGIGKAILAFQPPAIQQQLVHALEYPAFTPTTLTSPAALLRELDLIRARGFAYDLGEHENDVRCVAAPILSSAGVSLGGLSISAPAFRIGEEFTQRWPHLVMQGAREIASRLGQRPLPEVIAALKQT